MIARSDPETAGNAEPGNADSNAKFEEQFERLVKALRTDSEAREAPPEPKL